MKTLIYLFFTFLFISCEYKNENIETITERVNIPNVKLSLDIKIKSRLDKNEINEIAQELYKNYNGYSYENVFMEYSLPEMIHGNGIYATSHFMPQIQVQLYGLTNSESIKLVKSFNINDRYWFDDNWRMIIQIIKENDIYYLKKYAYDMSSSKQELIRKVNSPDTLYFIPNAIDHAYYLIDSSNELSLFDEKGFVYGFLKK